MRRKWWILVIVRTISRSLEVNPLRSTGKRSMALRSTGKRSMAFGCGGKDECWVLDASERVPVFYSHLCGYGSCGNSRYGYCHCASFKVDPKKPKSEKERGRRSWITQKREFMD